MNKLLALILFIFMCFAYGAGPALSFQIDQNGVAGNEDAGGAGYDYQYCPVIPASVI